MANVRSDDVVLLAGWCSGPLAREFRRILDKKKISVSETLERYAESYVREHYAEIGKPMPAGIQTELAGRRERKASVPWLAKPKKAKRVKRPSSSS